MNAVVKELDLDFRITLPMLAPSRGLATRLERSSAAGAGTPPLNGGDPAPRLALGFMTAQVSRVDQLPRGRHRRPLPAISLGKGLVRKYEAEKMYGIRRENGARKLTRLTRRHYEVVARHLSGQSGEQIHIYMGLSISTISRILNDPLVQTLLKKSYKDRQAELDALAGKAIGAVRIALEEGSTSEKLAAVDKYAKLKGAIAPESNPMESAEDFARAIVNNGTVNVQINQGRLYGEV
jgi:hypothetical protein